MGHVLTTYALSGRSYWVQELCREIYFLKHHLLWCCQCGMEYLSCFYSGAPLDIWKTGFLFQLFFCNVQLPLTKQQKGFKNHFPDANKRLKKRSGPRTFIIYLGRPLLHMEQWANILLYDSYLISKSLSFLIWILGIIIISPLHTSYDSSVVQHIWSIQPMAATQQCEWPFLYKAAEKKKKLVGIVAVRFKNNEQPLSKHLKHCIVPSCVTLNKLLNLSVVPLWCDDEMAINSLQPSQQEVGSSAPHLLNLGWPCGLALTKRLQQEWCCATSKLRPQGACSFSTCPLKTSLPCKQARASLLEITGPANSQHQLPDRWGEPLRL